MDFSKRKLTPFLPGFGLEKREVKVPCHHWWSSTAWRMPAPATDLIWGPGDLLSGLRPQEEKPYPGEGARRQRWTETQRQGEKERDSKKNQLQGKWGDACAQVTQNR